jgi:signal transduction histidine kinase
MEDLFAELKRYVGFGPAEEAALLAFGPLVRPHIPAIAAEFYDRIAEHQGARRVVQGGPAQVDRLKRTLSEWMERLTAGPWDQSYYELRARIGRRHVAIELPQQYMLTAMSVIRTRLDGIALTALVADDIRVGVHTVVAIDKLLDLELAIMLHTYREDLLAQMARRERLATYAQLMASVAHEIRNPLGVIESSLYILKRDAGDAPSLVRRVEQAQRQVQYANRIIADLLGMVRDRQPDVRPTRLSTVVDAAREHLIVPNGVKLEVDCPADLPVVAVDPDQLRQVLINLLGNALDAVGVIGHGRVRLVAGTDSTALVVRVEDEGPGIEPGVRGRLFEPLATSKPNGNGLGLALCKKLIEQNGGTITAEPDADAAGRGADRLAGAAFVVRLPLPPRSPACAS